MQRQNFYQGNTLLACLRTSRYIHWLGNAEASWLWLTWFPSKVPLVILCTIALSWDAAGQCWKSNRASFLWRHAQLRQFMTTAAFQGVKTNFWIRSHFLAFLFYFYWLQWTRPEGTLIFMGESLMEQFQNLSGSWNKCEETDKQTK